MVDFMTFPTKEQRELLEAADELEREWSDLQDQIDSGDTSVRSSWMSAKARFGEAVHAYRNAPRIKVVEITHIPYSDDGFQGILIPCIKVVRQYGGLSLREAKDLCDQVRDGTSQAVRLVRGNAESMIADLAKFGAKAHVVDEVTRQAVEVVCVDSENGLTSLVDPENGFLLYAEIVHRGPTSREIFANGRRLRIEIIESTDLTDGHPMPGGPY